MIVGSLVFFGLAGLLLVFAMRTPWHPKALETHLYRDGEYHTFNRIQPWGRARILALAAASALLGWLFLRPLV
jgi:hypothetical protein